LRLLLHPANFLLLDEPTNHLDMRAKDVLLEALAAYSGTVVLVSHDRYFIDKLATRVFEIGDGRVETYPGNYEDYRWRKEGRVAAAPTLDDMPMRGGLGNVSSASKVPRPALSAKSAIASEPANGNSAAGSSPAEEARGKRLNPIKRKQMEERVHEIEEDIARVEAAIAHCETALLTFVSAEETQRQTQELGVRRTELASLMAEWEEVSQTLEAAN
jgi:ATP-binding cassette, subfamily F, member 3